MASWEDLEARRRDAGKQVAGNPEFDRLCALCLSGPSGRALVVEMRRLTVDRPVNAFGAPESALRAMAAQSQFVRDIEAAIARGLAAMDAKGKTE